MTLSERVQRAGNSVEERSADEGLLLQTLRGQVQALVSVDELAQLAVDNPKRARSELRSACRRAFESLAWAYADQEMRVRLTDQLVDAVFGFGVLEDLIKDETIIHISWMFSATQICLQSYWLLSSTSKPAFRAAFSYVSASPPENSVGSSLTFITSFPPFFQKRDDSF